MSKYAIQVEILGKEYIIGGAEQRHESFREMLTGSLTAPFRKLRKLSGSASAEERFWALKEVSFNVQQGEVLGVIGRNGAGKSTLLKVLSRITSPTEGRIITRGRVASLLEVGTGFHPELTGRENIFLNGAILGMSKVEISKSFDEIVAFAEVEKFLDTPVKRYSSGMYVRLAFSVAAHLDSEVLVVDEVLAVGDVAFQKKCLGKMKNVSRNGKTVLFVSHNMAAIRNLCDRTIVLEEGAVLMDDRTDASISHYYSHIQEGRGNQKYLRLNGPLNSRIKFQSLKINGKFSGNSEIDPKDAIEFRVDGIATNRIEDVNIGIGIHYEGVLVATLNDYKIRNVLEKGAFGLVIQVSAGQLRPGRYTVGIGAKSKKNSEWCYAEDCGVFEIENSYKTQEERKAKGLINLKYIAKRYTSNDWPQEMDKASQ